MDAEATWRLQMLQCYSISTVLALARQQRWGDGGNVNVFVARCVLEIKKLFLYLGMSVTVV